MLILQTLNSTLYTQNEHWKSQYPILYKGPKLQVLPSNLSQLL